MFRFPKFAWLLLGVVILAGCATRPLPPASPPQQEPQQPRGHATPLPSEQAPQVIQPTQPQTQRQKLPPSKPGEISSSAVMSLLNSADTQVHSGNPSRAAAILQRALNIEPRNPFIYQRLAAVRLAQKQFQQAEELAYKSNSLASNNPFVQADNWLLIAESRRLRGDSTGQQQAMARVEQLRLQSAALQ